MIPVQYLDAFRGRGNDKIAADITATTPMEGWSQDPKQWALNPLQWAVVLARMGVDSQLTSRLARMTITSCFTVHCLRRECLPCFLCCFVAVSCPACSQKSHQDMARSGPGEPVGVGEAPERGAAADGMGPIARADPGAHRGGPPRLPGVVGPRDRATGSSTPRT